MYFKKAIQTISLDGIMPAVVVDNKSSGEIAVWIPRLMSSHAMYEKPEVVEVSLNSAVIRNQEPKGYKSTFSTSVKTCNYLWMDPLQWSRESYGGRNDVKIPLPPGYDTREAERMGTLSGTVPKIGETVLVLFFDGDPQKGYYLPLKPR